jgi:hypothetical protein
MKKKLTILLHVAILLNSIIFAGSELSVMLKPLAVGIAIGALGKIFQENPSPHFTFNNWLGKTNIKQLQENILLSLKTKEVKYDRNDPLICSREIQSNYLTYLRILNDKGFVIKDHEDLAQIRNNKKKKS